MFSFAVSSRRSYLIEAVGRWRWACGDIEAIAHRMSEAHLLAIHFPARSSLSPGSGDYLRPASDVGVGGEGVGR